MNRRILVAGAAAACAARGSVAAQVAIADSWEDASGDILVEWEPIMWKPIDEIESGKGTGIRLGTSTVFGVPKYAFSAGQFETEWTSIADARNDAIDTWFSQGMQDTIIFDEFETDNAYGWIHYADFMGNPRTVSVLQYLRLETVERWVEIAISIDVDEFERLDIEDVFDAITLNGESVLIVDRPRTLTRAIEDAFDA